MDVGVVGTVGGVGGPARYTKEMLKRMRHNSYGVVAHDSLVRRIPPLSPAASMPIRTALRDFSRYDIIHNLPAYPFFPMRRGRALLVTTAHEFQYVLYPELNAVSGHTMRDLMWDRLVVEPSIGTMMASDYLIANSMQTRDEAVRLKVPSKRIFLATHGVDERFLAGLPKKRGKRQGFRVGYTGTLIQRKNVLFGIRAFRQFDHPTATLELWGNDMYPGGKVKEAMGDDRRIKLMGQPGDSDMIRVYDSFDAFLFPSLYEGCGLPILEARSRGLPVILFKDGHISEEVRAFCFEAKDEGHMADILGDLYANGYSEKLRRKSTAQARRYTWQATAEKTMAAYVKMVG